MTARRSSLPGLVAFAAGLVAGNPALAAAWPSTSLPRSYPRPTATFADEQRLLAAEAKRAQRAARRLGGQAMMFYGYFWTDCIYESGLMLQSLHRSKVGALRAMIAAQAAHWEDCRSGANSGRHCDGFGTFEQLDYRAYRESQAFAVRPVRLQP